jgi:UDP-N-acetylglucosamine 1-carboxyvinyltransferase
MATLLIDKGETVIKNVPPLRDIYTTIKVMQHLGAKVTYDDKRQVMTVNAEDLTENTAPYELMRQMRASFLVLGPLMARLGQARVSLPGGCVLGSRPVDFHIQAFKALGATVQEKAGYVIARCKQLQGTKICFDRPSHTGTENVMFAAALAKGRTVITNAACDPEIIDVANFMNSAGAKISGAGTPTLTIDGVRRLKCIEHRVQGDRLVAGTFLIGAAMTRGEVKVTGVVPEYLTMVTHKLEHMGCRVTNSRNAITVKGPRRLKPVAVTTFPYPGFPTDLQACMMAATCIAEGTSQIRETVFSDRFSHTMEMRRLGADINVTGDEAIINGTGKLEGAEVMASDIRAGAGIVLATLAAKGRSEVLRVYHIDRGYSSLELKLAELGADITRSSV